MNKSFYRLLSIIVVAHTIQVQPVMATYFFQGDTVSLVELVSGIPNTITLSQPNVSSSNVNPQNNANGAYFSTQGSIGVPFSAVPEGGSLGFSGTSDTSIYFADQAAVSTGGTITLKFSNLGWAQNPGNPSYISGISYLGLQPGSSSGASFTLAALPFVVSPHGVTIDFSYALNRSDKLQANFGVTMATPVMTLPTIVGHTITANLQATDFSGNIVGAGTNQFNNLLTPVSATVIGNSATPEFTAAASSITFNAGTGNNTYGMMALTANLDSNIIDLIWTTPSSCAGNACNIAPTKLTLTNILDAAGLLAGYQITSLELLAGRLPAGLTLLNTVITGGDVSLYFSGGLVSAGQTYEALFHAVDSAPPDVAVPEPATYLLLTSLLVMGVGIVRRRVAKPVI